MSAVARAGACAALALALTGALALPVHAGSAGRGTTTPTAVPASLVTRAAIDLGVAINLAGRPLPIGVGAMAQAAAALPTLGRRERAGLVRVVRLSGLRLGASGRLVTLLQARLAGLGRHLALDGDFGPATEAALKAVQARLGAVATGEVRTTTWRLLLGTSVPAGGETLWALAARYGTSVASLAAWNGAARDTWLRPWRGEVWIMPADVRPAATMIGSGRPTFSDATSAVVSAGKTASGRASGPTSATAPGASDRQGKGDAPAVAGVAAGKATSRGVTAPSPAHGGTVLLAIDIRGPASAAALARLAAWLGGHQVEATVLLTPAELAGRGAIALALEGEDIGVALAQAVSRTTLLRALAAAQKDTGVRPVVAYAGSYPTAVDAALAGGSGLALLAGTSAMAAPDGPMPDGVVVLAASASAALHRLPSLVRAARVQRERIAAVSSALRLSPGG